MINENNLEIFLTIVLLRIKIHTLETPDSCTHEVAVPPNFEFTGLKDSVSKLLDCMQKKGHYF